MLGLLLLVFVIAPIVELYVIVQVASGIGVLETLGLLVLVSIVGAWLAKLAGLGVLNRLRQTVLEGRVPSSEVVDGVLVLVAGALMIAPGFVSDALAILLLLPPTRAVVRGALLRRIRAGGGLVNVVVSGRGAGARPRPDGVWDADSWENPPSPPDRPQLDP